MFDTLNNQKAIAKNQIAQLLHSVNHICTKTTKPHLQETK